MKFLLRKKLEELVRQSSSHGIPNLFRAENTAVRVLWIVCVLASCGYCTYTIVKSIIDYSKYETTVSIQRVQELPQVFPAVTFCNVNPLNNGNSFTQEYIYLFFNSIRNPECLDFFTACVLRNASFCREIQEKIQACFMPVTFRVRQLRQHAANLAKIGFIVKEIAGYDLRTVMLKSCKFNNEPCSADNFTQYWSYEFGYCYTFNGGGNLKTSNKGGKAGLELEINVKFNLTGATYGVNNGLYLAIHNQSTVPYALYNGITLPTGHKIVLDVNRVFNEKLPSPYSACIDELSSDNLYARRLFGFFRELNISYYQQEICFNLCYQDKLIEKCGCSSLVTPTIRNTLYCATDAEMDCQESFDEVYFQSDLNSFCGYACPQNCKFIEYNTLGIQFASYPTLDRVLELKNSGLLQFPDNVNSSSVLQSIGERALMQININYENTFYTLIKEKPTRTFETLLGTIGGVLGLFVGISFLSLIELVELVIEFLFIYMKYRKELEEQ